MMGQDLRELRHRRGWSQGQLAQRLGVSQAYVSMLEAGRRKVGHSLARRAVRLLPLSPTRLPLSTLPEREDVLDNQALAEYLAKLGYPGLTYLRTRRRLKNPAEVLLTALAKSDLEARLVEALPWLLLHYGDMDGEWLAREARLQNLQNRLGYLVTLARKVAERNPANLDRLERLQKLEAELDRSRLAHEDTLCHTLLGERESQWLRENRPEEATHWNLLADWRPELLRYVS